MIFQRLRVFVSSKIDELEPERRAVKAALDVLKVDAWLFEQDAGARSQSIQKAFLEEVEAADVYVGLFWQGFGQYTFEEYEHARRLGKDCLLYEKRADPVRRRDQKLQSFLDQVGDVNAGLTIKRFDTLGQLSEAIKEDIAQWQKRKIDERHKRGVTVTLTRADKKDRDDQLVLLRKVKTFWISGVLDHSVHQQAIIDIGKAAWEEARGQPWARVVELPDQSS